MKYFIAFTVALVIGVSMLATARKADPVWETAKAAIEAKLPVATFGTPMIENPKPGVYVVAGEADGQKFNVLIINGEATEILFFD